MAKTHRIVIDCEDFLPGMAASFVADILAVANRYDSGSQASVAIDVQVLNKE